MDKFISFCNQLSPLDEEATKDLLNKAKQKSFQKGDLILRRGEVCRYLYFIDKGLTKLFFSTEEKEFIMRFFAENAMFTSLDSYLTQTPAHYEIMALEPTELTLINFTTVETLCQKHHSVETVFRKLISVAALNMMKRVSEMLDQNASERYKNFVNENNALLQRISLGDLASYLGITQVSLSRIRAQK